jgi:hypothetical protein
MFHVKQWVAVWSCIFGICACYAAAARLLQEEQVSTQVIDGKRRLRLRRRFVRAIRENPLFLPVKTGNQFRIPSAAR